MTSFCSDHPLIGLQETINHDLIGLGPTYEKADFRLGTGTGLANSFDGTLGNGVRPVTCHFHLVGFHHPFENVRMCSL